MRPPVYKSGEEVALGEDLRRDHDANQLMLTSVVDGIKALTRNYHT
jgi:hypothetical protein